MLIILIFALCTLLNVVLATIKSVMTIKGSKISAAVWNALSFGLYTYIVILTANADLTTLEKVIITVICNLIGVYAVKLVEEKMRKDRLWKWEVTVQNSQVLDTCHALTEAGISYNYIENVGKHTIFNIYAQNQKESMVVEQVIKQTGAKAFASETKLAP